MSLVRVAPLGLWSVLLFACLEKPPGTPEPQPEPLTVPPMPVSSAPSPVTDSPHDPARASDPVIVESVDGKDPLGGNFTLADATAGLPGEGPLVATIETSRGALRCKLEGDKAPVTVANFVGLARGTRPFRSHVDGRWMKKPFYDGTGFHRIVKGFMIQGGDPLGNGTGGPGYDVIDEIWPGATHDRAGLLCMANRGKNTNGSQFFITDAPARQLDGNYTIFGQCAPVALVHEIAGVPTGSSDRPLSPVTIDKIEISR